MAFLIKITNVDGLLFWTERIVWYEVLQSVDPPRVLDLVLILPTKHVLNRGTVPDKVGVNCHLYPCPLSPCMSLNAIFSAYHVTFLANPNQWTWTSDAVCPLMADINALKVVPV